jgi:hypothetical protein
VGNGSGEAGSGTTGAPVATGRDGAFSVGASPIDGADLIVDGQLGGLDALVDFAVPSLVLTVPGLLVMLAVLAQGFVGALWLPVARRWLGGFGLRRQRDSPTCLARLPRGCRVRRERLTLLAQAGHTPGHIAKNWAVNGTSTRRASA